MEPKIFISYSWSSIAHRERVRQIADRLIGDGVEVVIDIYDLNEGNDKHAFMERMVLDPTITNVLVMCDEMYSQKANDRKRGVGTESQIISQKIYTEVEQTKFIPIFCDVNEDNEPYLPVFMNALIGIDFSSPEKENENWERLIRVLHRQPLHKKPKLGKRPAFLDENSYEPVSEVLAKFNSLKYALLQEKKGISHYRDDFLTSAFSYLDNMRVRVAPEDTTYINLAKKIIADLSAMKPIRNLFCDWLLLENEFTGRNELNDVLMPFFESILALPLVPKELNSYQINWFDAQKIFSHEVYLYSIACMIKKGSFGLINDVYTSRFMVAEMDISNRKNFLSYSGFLSSSETVQHGLSDGTRYQSPVGELFKRQAERSDVTFNDIIEADVLTLAYSLVGEGAYWYPVTLPYASYNSTPDVFLRATQHKGFLKLSEALGVNSAEIMRTNINARNLSNMSYGRGMYNLEILMNLNNLDSLR